MTEQWQELRETIIELRDNDGTGTQQEVCKFLVNLMDILEKQMQEPKMGHWIEHPEIETSTPKYLMFYECSECGDKQCFCKSDIHKKHFCNNCGARMVKPQESEDKE